LTLVKKVLLSVNRNYFVVPDKIADEVVEVLAMNGYDVTVKGIPCEEAI